MIGFVEKSLRAHDQSQTAEEREAFERKIAVMRRIVLALDILLFGGLGYWIGETLGRLMARSTAIVPVRG